MTDTIASTAATGTATSTQANIVAGANNLNLGYNDFLTLLTEQLKNQDPTSPLDTNQFTQQLVQLTGVQQQLLSNQLLQTLVNNSGGNGATGISSASLLIGKSVDATSNAATINNGQAQWGYALDGDATAATFTVSDSNGDTVYTGPAPDLSSGEHAFTWNGKSTTGVQMPDGETYTLAVSASDAKGGAITAQTQISGVVSFATIVNGAVQLKIGANTAPYSAVTTVRAAN